MKSQIIIGITGTIGAGKGTITDYLKTRGFGHFTARGLFIEEIKKRDMPVDRDSMRFVSNDLREKFGGDYVVKELYRQVKESGTNAVIESIRTVDEVNFIKQVGILISVDADIHTRYDRAVKRNSETDQISFEKFKEQEELESRSDDPKIQNLKKCKELTDPKFRFNNDGTLEDLYRQVDEALKNFI